MKNQERTVLFSEEELISKTIATIRFPMAFLVVMIHGYFSRVILNGGKTVIDYTTLFLFPKVTLLVGEIASVAVPVFYLISGFLYFYKVSEFNKKCYFSKLKKRVHSLLIPYLIWNLLSTLVFLLGQLFIPDIFSGNSSNIIEYTWKDWLLIFWNDSNSGYPASSQLWFLRDLMIVVLASPLVYLFVKYTKLFGILLLWVLWVFDCEPAITGINITSFFLFSLGAYFSIHKKDFVSLSLKINKKGLGVLYLALLILAIVFENTVYTPFIHKICITTGIFFCIGVTAKYLLTGGKEYPFLSKSSMFIYLIHVIPIIFLKKIAIMVFHPSNDLGALLVYFTCPVVITLICLSLFWVMCKYVPKFTSVITGGRI